MNDYGEVDIAAVMDSMLNRKQGYAILSSAAKHYGFLEEADGDTIAAIEDMVNALMAAEYYESTVAKTAAQLAEENEKVAAGVELTNTALEEMTTAGGLTSATMQSLIDRYEDVDGYSKDDLFEYTANGIMLNTQVLREYEDAVRTDSMVELKKNLRKLKQAFADGALELTHFNGTVEEYEDKISALEDLADETEAVEELIAQYEGLTSAYTEWQRAKETPNPGDIYDQAVDDRETLEELYKQGNIGRDDFTAGVKFFFGG